MYYIALCDDDAKEFEQVECFLKKYQHMKKMEDYKLEWFISAEALLDRIREKNLPDLLLLDIFMGGKTGIEAAEEMRNWGCKMPIIFLTASTEHALNAYGVDAIQYLIKPLNQERFFHAMDIAVGLIQQKNGNQIIIKVAGGIRQIQPNDVVYCESQKNYQILYLATENLKVRMTSGSLWEIMEKFPQFGRCGRSYILNMNHILSMEREEIVMDNRSVIYIPRNKAAEFKKKYFAYYFDQKNEVRGGYIMIRDDFIECLA